MIRSKLRHLLLSLFLVGYGSAALSSEPFIGEIRWVGFNFEPRGWAFCDGRLLPINQNEALFSLFGTFYGGDGRTNFALPDLRGRVQMGMGNGPGLTPRNIGQKVGAEKGEDNVMATVLFEVEADEEVKQQKGKANGHETVDLVSAINGEAELNASVEIDVVQPSLVLNCIVALQGIFPSRS